MPLTIASLFKASSLISSARPLFMGNEKSMIGDVVIDSARVEIIEYKAKISEHPVESRKAVTDHIYDEPLRITIEGSISDSSIKFMNIFEMPLQNNTLEKISDNVKSLLPLTSENKPSHKAYEALKEYFKDKQPIKIGCKLGIFDDMVIEDFKTTNDENTGEQLQFTAQLKQIKFAYVRTQKSTRVADKKVQALTAEKADMGRVELMEENIAGQKTSILKGLFN